AAGGLPAGDRPAGAAAAGAGRPAALPPSLRLAADPSRLAPRPELAHRRHVPGVDEEAAAGFSRRGSFGLWGAAVVLGSHTYLLLIGQHLVSACRAGVSNVTVFFAAAGRLPESGVLRLRSPALRIWLMCRVSLVMDSAIGVFLLAGSKKKRP